MVGELIAIFPRHSGDLSSLKKFTQTAKVCAFSLGRSVSGASYRGYACYIIQTKNDQRRGASKKKLMVNDYRRFTKIPYKSTG